MELDNLSKLIQELCPDGVEYVKLGECCEILDAKRKPVSKAKRVAGEYPYYGANGIQDYVDSYLFDGTFLLLGEDGSVINKDKSPVLNWAIGKIWVNNHAHILAEKSSVASLRYLFFCLQCTDVSSIVRGTPPKLNQENLRSIEIPLPPLEVQTEIVRILDQVSRVSAELEAELELRKKQYKYICKKILTFGDDVEWKKLGEVCEVKTGQQLNKSNLSKIGDYPCINGGLKPSGYTDKYNETGNKITISQGGASAGFVNWMDNNFWAGAHCYIIKPNSDNILNRYLYFFLKYKESKLMNLKIGAGIPNLNRDKINNFLIPIPSLEKQQEIVSILDPLDRCINSVSKGLPAEIKLRKFQYKFIRDKILTFKRK